MGNSRPKRRKTRKSGRRRKPWSFKVPRGVSKHWVEIVLGVVVAFLAATIYVIVSGQPVEDEYVRDDVGIAQHPDEIVEKAPEPEAEVAVITPVIPPKPKPKPKAGARPRIAIIIDDLGADIKIVERLLAIDAPLAFAVLPHLKYSRSVARNASRRKRVVMLHLPMEPISKKFNPGEGALLVSQSRAQIIKTFKHNLASIPGAVGVNNHMGSRFTENKIKSRIVIEEIKKEGLFFIDSRTTAATVAHDLALEVGTPTAMRDVFLDNERDKTKIMEALLALADKAIMNGSAIGIGHPYKETASALEEMLPKIGRMGVEVAPITQFLVREGE